MSGHSKWATTKRKKARIDVARAKVFNRILREITVAARSGGSNPESNARLRTAILKAKSANMPAKNIETAAAKGAGELEGVQYIEITYEGYGPGGIAILVDTVTDNKVRTVAEVRNAFSKNGGNAGEEGSVGWMFKNTGVISLPKSSIAEEALFELATENGADDFDAFGEEYEIRVDPAHYHALLDIIHKKGLPTSSAELSMVAENMIKLSGESSDKAIALLEALDDLDDVQNVHTNAEFENS